MARVRNRKPVHPGTVFQQDVLEPLHIRITDAADHLGISRKHLSLFVNGRIGCSKDMAIRLAHATTTSVESWLNMQAAVDAWEAEHELANEAKYAAIKPLCRPAA